MKQAQQPRRAPLQARARLRRQRLFRLKADWWQPATTLRSRNQGSTALNLLINGVILRSLFLLTYFVTNK